jgi:DNA-binding CsgD family transcriptional regulator
MTTIDLAAITAETAGLQPPSGAACWALAVGLGVGLFLAARAADTYRHRLKRDRALAEAYRRSQVQQPAQTTTAASSRGWTTTTSSTRHAGARTKPATAAALHKHATRQKDITLVLGGTPGSTAKEIADCLSVRPTSIYQALYRLEEKNLVRRGSATATGDGSSVIGWYLTTAEAGNR